MTKVAWVWLRSMVSFMSFTPWCGGGTVEDSAEAVQAAFGGQPLPADPVRGGRQRPGDELVGADPADLRRGDDPGRLQDAQVLDDRGERHRRTAGPAR